MSTFFTLLKKELAEQARSKKLLILAIVFLFVAVSSAILAKLLPQILSSSVMQGIEIKIPEPTYKDAIDQFVKNISQLALFVFVFVVAGSISDEKNKRTLEILFTKPVSRTSFVLAKFISYFLSISILYTISAIIFYFYTKALFGQFDLINFLIMAKAVLIYILLIVSATIFGSSFSANSIIATVVGFIAMIVFGTVVPLIHSIKDYSPYVLLSNYKEIAQNGWSSNLTIPLVTAVTLIFIFIISTIYVVKNQEVER